jgi:hypothetical protein
MYYTEKTLYLLWESNKRFIHSPKPTIERPVSSTSVRSRSPSPTSSIIRAKFALGRQNDNFILCSSLKQLDDFSEDLRGWREVSEKYITETLSISHDIPYKIQTVYINNDCKCVFKVFVYEVDIEKVKELITSHIQIFEKINVTSVICDKYTSKLETAVVKVNCSTKDICIFTLLGRDRFSFTIYLDNLQESPKHCFDAFRSLCRTDKLLTDLFEKSIVQYLDIGRESIVPIISGIVNYNNGKL